MGFIAEIKQQVNESVDMLYNKINKLKLHQENILDSDLYDEGYYNGIELALKGNSAKFRWNARNNMNK